MAAQRGLSASRWRLSVLRVSSCLSQLSRRSAQRPVSGQKMQQPAGQTLHHRQRAEGDEPHDDARHDSVGPGQIPQHTVGVGRYPGAACQKQHGGVKQDGCLVEDVLQGHQPHAGADVQPAPVEIPRLKRHRPCAEAHHIAEGPHPCIVDTLPQREMGQAAADDEPAGYALEKRVAQAHGQCQQPLPEGEPAQRLGDLGPVLPEDEHHDAGQQGQNASESRVFRREGAGEADELMRGLLSNFNKNGL